MQILIFSGCINSTTNNSERSKFVGTWIDEDNNKILFFSDGTTPNFFLGLTAYWQIKDGKLTISVSSDVTFDYVYDYSFSENNTILSLTLIMPENYSNQTIKYFKNN